MSTRAPKRQVLRINNRLDDTIANTVSNVILHTATDPETLVRTIIDLYVVAISATAVDHEYHMMIERSPGGTKILNPFITQALDQDTPEALIWENSGVVTLETVVGFIMPIHVQADLRSMRKLKPGDTIVWSHIGNIASTFTVKGTITLFFKQ